MIAANYRDIQRNQTVALHDDAVGQGNGLADVMGYQNGGKPVFQPYAREKFVHFKARKRVKCVQCSFTSYAVIAGFTPPAFSN